MDRSNLYNLYYLALFGALGGLLAWRLTSLHLVISGFNIYTRDLILGVILGIVIGDPVGFAYSLYLGMMRPYAFVSA